VIYLDHHATTPVDARVLEAMLPWFRERFGNAASRSHAYGHRAADAVDRARAQVASLIGGRPEEIVWTSGATESDNLALKGVLEASDRPRLITQKTEHKAVLDSAKRLAREGAEVVFLDVDGDGRIAVGDLRDALDERTALVSLMLANNEVGATQPLAEAAAAAHEVGAWLHVDASQGLGYLPFDVDAVGADLVSLTAHKIYGPKGVGALFVRRRDRRVRVASLIDGGGHERGMRSGTLNVPGIVGFGAAAALQQREGPEEAERLRDLARRLWSGVDAALEEVHLNGPPLGEPRHPGNVNISFGFVDGEGLLLALAEELAVSSGSACSSASVEPSFVLRAMGVDPNLASSSIRYGLGRETTAAEVDRAVAHTVECVTKLRADSPLWEMHQRGETLDW